MRALHSLVPTSLLVLQCMASSTATASSSPLVPASSIDLYYVGLAEVEIGDIDFDDGDGYGGRLRFLMPGNLFLSGEYQNTEYDSVERDSGGVLGGSERFEVELESWRGGLGYHFAESPFYVLGEYIGFEAELSTTGEESDEEGIGDDIDESGFGVHAGVNGRLSDMFDLYGQVGYVDVGDAGDGPEYLAGAALSFNPRIGLFADYRFTDLEEDIDTQVSGVRVGLRASFR